MKQTKIKIQNKRQTKRNENLLKKTKTIELLRNNLFRNTTIVFVEDFVIKILPLLQKIFF